MDTKTEEALKRGYSFHGAWLSFHHNEEESRQFKEKRQNLKKEGYKVLTLPLDGGKGLYVKHDAVYNEGEVKNG